MRGIIMAGGLGSRLSPLTNVTNKHLLPIYDKPLIYYPLTTLMLAGIRDILLISSPLEIPKFQQLLGDGSEFGINLNYLHQEKPAGIAQGITLAEDFVKNHKVALILGDNIFHGSGLGRQLGSFKSIEGAHIFAYKVRDPHNYGVVEIDDDGKVISIEEKPSTPKSNLAIPGLYFFDELALYYAQELKPSARGELEITDLNKKYLEQGNLQATILSQGTAWLDCGTFEGLHDASSYIRIVEQRQNSRIGDPLTVSKVQNWQ